MQIMEAGFEISAARPDQFPKGTRPEIALVGRSNVGKSSLINTVVNKRNLAHVGATPGKTRLANFFLINERGESFYLVDLPGYGFAKVSKEERAQWALLIEEYLTNRQQLRLVVQIVDARHPPSQDDLAMLAWLRERGVAYCVAAAKIDKVPKTRRVGQLRQLSEAIGAQALPFSAVTGEGRSDLLRIIGGVL